MVASCLWPILPRQAQCRSTQNHDGYVYRVGINVWNLWTSCEK